ncbi:RsmB/NOP family class I SAM-dependent RNA methyltransferase [Gayadomonas joobiniege]|uniref:RsmB/NOP family class I SAM-dependent RNA methyltransferase n=1 Tax=Gayadomonas joobiniege TaxID=1234606 RepID=UPI00036AA370|nr:RsmB/NOP family class I SAM-dependent RNA methyltransferase [Gayadomonas joobiniege]
MKRRSYKKPLPGLSLVVARKQLWLEWCQQQSFKPLDRFLKSRLKEIRDLKREDKLKLSAQIQNAARYLQSAEYLESCYQQDKCIDALAWDKEYQTLQLKINNIQCFWFWVFLLAGDYTHASTANEAARVAWFKKQLSKLEADLSCFAILHGFRPKWLTSLNQRALMQGWQEDEVRSFIKKQNIALPLYLRNQSELTDKQLTEQLQANGVRAYNDHAVIQVSGGHDVTRTDLYKNGQFEIQDLASQKIAEAVDCRPGLKVWDACAGAGGKSLALAWIMKGKGALTATDLHAYKLDELSKRSKRAQIHNIRCFTWTGESELKLPNDVRRQQGFDRVLIDAPCTSSGTWRRNPDARWRFSESDTLAQNQIQRKLLNNASRSVRIGGLCVYATCSWQVSENEAIVAEFLNNNANFKLREQCFLGGIKENSDSMFYAVLERLS